MDKRIVVVAGEPSGDLHGSNMARDLIRLDPEIKLSGIGGEKMSDAGVQLYHNIEEMAVLGFFDVIKKYGKFKEIFNHLLTRIDELKPSAVILIDYPGFNLKLAKQLKQRQIPVIYYISPQIWAWGKNRIELIKRVTDKLIVFFKFEEKLYKEHGVRVCFVGHPLLDIARPSMDKEKAQEAFGLTKDRLTIGIMPGSREGEVKRMLPVMLEAACMINKKLRKQVQFVITKSPILKGENFHKFTAGCKGLDLHVVSENIYDGINVSDFILACSGTATLETAIIGKPLLIIYKVSHLSWLMFRRLVKIPDIGLVNVVAGERVVPELLQYKATASKIASEALKILGDKERMEKIGQDLTAVKDKLGSPGASQRAAQAVLDFLK